MSHKDLLNVAKMTETVGALLNQHRSSLHDRCVTGKARAIKLKNSFKDTAFAFDHAKDNIIGCFCEKGCLENAFIPSLQNVIHYLLNIYSHVGLSGGLSHVEGLRSQ